MLGPLTVGLERRPVSDVIFDILRDAIIDGRLVPGQWLRQEGLAQELRVSQMPVREALRRLVAEGLAVRTPYKGVQVIEFSPQDIMDMYSIRLALESLAVRFATPIVTPETLQALAENLELAGRLQDPEEMPRRRALNTDFHLTICRASGHRYLVRQVEALWRWFPSVLLYEGMRRQEELAADRLARENREHRAILAALQCRDRAEAERMTRAHIWNLIEELAEVLGVSKDLIYPFIASG